MAIRHDLYMHEQLVLLGLHDDSGKRESNQWSSIGIAAAVLAELWFEERIRLDRSRPKRPPLVDVADRTPVGQPLLDEALDRIVKGKRRAVSSTWVARLSGLRRLLERTAEPLVHRGILRHERVPFLVFFERSVFPTVNPEPEQRVIAGIRTAMNTELPDIPVRTRVLIGIADVTGMLRPIYNRKELKQLKPKLKAIRESEPFTDAAELAVSAAIAAVAAASAG